MSATDIAKSIDVDLNTIREQAAAVAEELIQRFTQKNIIVRLKQIQPFL